MSQKTKFWAICIVGLVAIISAGIVWRHGGELANFRGPAVRSQAINTAAAPAEKSAAVSASGPVVVEAVRVTKTSLVDDLNAVGAVRSNESVVLRPEISGRIAALGFREGQRVKRGDVLVQLDDSIARAELQQAQAQLALAKSNYERTADLARQNFVSESAKDQAASTLKIQESAVLLAQTRLAKSAIRAPFDGTVGVRQIAVGDYVKEGQDMVAIEDTATVKIDFRIPERYLGQVRVGQRFIVETDALPGRQFDLTVGLIDPQVDANGRSVLVRGRINNADAALRPGMFARVRLVFDERANALTIPEEALVPAGSTNFVYRVSDVSGTLVAQRLQVQTGLRRDGRVEIREGLQANDLVVVAGQIKLRGDATPVRLAEPNAPAATTTKGEKS
ncbi:MAG TPA: efflux RND transporter periplasmic adaptor subunit [Burkholderiaceae bacterium]|nr:efflux RND transporter periplasmic adaptor subunit [Burkholderiaceae bacterium]